MNLFVRRPFAVTMGDACGIGPEIIVKMIADSSCPRYPIFVVGDVGVMSRAIKILGLPIKIKEIFHPEELKKGYPDFTLPVLQCSSRLPEDLPWGHVDSRAGHFSFLCIEQAAHFALSQKTEGIITAPINKNSLAESGCSWVGHTEILTHITGSQNTGMLLASDELRVILVSIHISLKEAIERINPENEFESIRLAHQACNDFGIRFPRIAVAGLNPHAGENGLFGSEEQEQIKPAIEKAQEIGMNVSGPWPADTIFMRARSGEFDVVVAQYHDQGLLPIKYLGIGKAANITVGLPFIRTSVDHGTAFDLAWLGRSSHQSLLYAFKKALELVDSRMKNIA